MTFEGDALTSVPARLAGPLAVAVASFWAIAVIRMVLTRFPLPCCTGGETADGRSETAKQVITTLHALLVSTAGIRMHFFAHDAAEPSMAWGSSEAQFYVAFSAAVFSARVLKGMATLTQAKVDAAWTQDGHTGYGQPAFIHATFGLAILSWVLVTGQGHYFATRMMCWELTTVFFNAGQFLQAHTPGMGWLHVANDVCLVWSYVLLRLVDGVPLAWAFVQGLLALYSDGGIGNLEFVFLSAVVISLPLHNLLWFLKLAHDISTNSTTGQQLVRGSTTTAGQSTDAGGDHDQDDGELVVIMASSSSATRRQGRGRTATKTSAKAHTNSPSRRSRRRSTSPARLTAKSLDSKTWDVTTRGR